MFGVIFEKWYLNYGISNNFSNIFSNSIREGLPINLSEFNYIIESCILFLNLYKKCWVHIWEGFCFDNRDDVFHQVLKNYIAFGLILFNASIKFKKRN